MERVGNEGAVGRRQEMVLGARVGNEPSHHDVHGRSADVRDTVPEGLECGESDGTLISRAIEVVEVEC